MKTMYMDIWKVYDEYVMPRNDHTVIVIPTNGFVKRNGYAVMGRGLAHDAAGSFNRLPLELGIRLQWYGNIPHYFQQYKIITFPTKHTWSQPADLYLIQQSAESLNRVARKLHFHRIYIPKVGCGNGQLDWEHVKPILDETLTEKCFVLVCNPKEQ